jgi:spermidine synthase
MEFLSMNGTNVKNRYLPFLLMLFVGSGSAALIYEVVWFQLLELVIGSSAASIGVLLGTFMGGMCLGSFLLPRFVSRDKHPLRVYAAMEFGIGILGLILLFAMPLIGGVYTAWAGSGFVGMFMRSIIAAICLLPPTLLMGATLPAISRWVEATPNGISWLGFFYGGNIAGAVIGSLLAGFYLLRVHDILFATFVAVAINVGVALLSLAIAKQTRYEPAAQTVSTSSQGVRSVYVTIALSGLTALACEVIWTRLLSLLFGATVYAFSLILAVFLLGLGIGSSAGSAMSRNLKSPRMALGFCQFLLCAAMTWAAYALTTSLPYWPIDVQLSTDPWIKLQLDMVRAMWAMLPAAILWGASFPLALASVAREGQDPGKLVGSVYAANTVGAIVGSLTASLMLVYFFGTQHSQQVLVGLSALSALLMLAPLAAEDEPSKSKLNVIVTAFLIVVAVGMLAYRIPAVPNALVAYGRFLPTRNGQGDVFFMGEGLQASVAVSRLSNGTLNYHNAGKVQASSDPADMRLQRMLGHLTTLIPDEQKTFMVIGCGAGVTAGAVSIEPKLEEEIIVEIEPLVPKVADEYFGEHNFNVIKNPKVKVVIDDGRHFLLTTKKKFDGITSDPLDPWVKGAAMLYTREFFELVKQHLNPGGVVTLFVQFYESNEEAVKSEIATFFEAFPNGAVFANTIQGSGYDVVLFGKNESTPIDVDRMNRRLSSPEYGQIAGSLREVGFYSALDLLATFAGRPTDLQGWLANANINRDRNLRLQYLAGMSLNLYQADPIYKSMISAGVRYPDGFFMGSPAMIDTLRQAIETAQFR